MGETKIEPARTKDGEYLIIFGIIPLNKDCSSEYLTLVIFVSIAVIHAFPPQTASNRLSFTGTLSVSPNIAAISFL